MKLSTAKRRINKTLDELTQSVIDDWYANFKNGYIKGYADARHGISPMYAEAYATADTPQTDCDTCRHYKLACELFSEVCKYEPTTQNSNLTFETDTPQTDCENCAHWEHGAGQHYYCALLEMGQECYFESKDESTLMFANVPQTDCGWK